ncbi:MAG: hypothetical protein QGI60_00450 [archaeon]|jgi:hypothetical protein|nr:hypothetical protein [archaeon]
MPKPPKVRDSSKKHSVKLTASGEVQRQNAKFRWVKEKRALKSEVLKKLKAKKYLASKYKVGEAYELYDGKGVHKRKTEKKSK